MSEEYTHQLLRMVVAQICQPLGWQGMTTSSCEVLVDVMKRYMLTVARTTASYSNHANRTEPNLFDLAQSFNDLGISLPEISEYCRGVESAKLNYTVPKFPIPKTSTHVYHPSGTGRASTRVSRSSRSSSLSSEEDYIPDYLPPLPSKKGAEKDDDAESGIQDSDHEETGEEARKTPGDTLKGLPQLFRSQRMSSDFSEDGESSSRRNSVSDGTPIGTLFQIPEAAVEKAGPSEGATVTQTHVPAIAARGKAALPQGPQKNVFDVAFAKKLADAQPRVLTQVPTTRPEPLPPQQPKPPPMTKKPPPLRLMSPSTDTVPPYPIQQPPLSPLRSTPSPIRPTRPGLPILSPIQRPAVGPTRPVIPVMHSRITSPPMVPPTLKEQITSPTQTTIPPIRAHPGMVSPLRAHPPPATTAMQPPQMPPMMSTTHGTEKPRPSQTRPLQPHPLQPQELPTPMGFQKVDSISPSYSPPQEQHLEPPAKPAGHQKAVKKETISPQSYTPPQEHLVESLELTAKPVDHQKRETFHPRSFSPPQEFPPKPVDHQKRETFHPRSFSPPQEFPPKPVDHQKRETFHPRSFSPPQEFPPKPMGHLKRETFHPQSFSPPHDFPSKPMAHQKRETFHPQSFSPPHDFPSKPKSYQKAMEMKEVVHPQSFSPPHDFPSKPMAHQKRETFHPQSFSPPHDFPSKPKSYQKAMEMKEVVHPQSFSPPQEFPTKPKSYQKAMEMKEVVHPQSFTLPQEHFHFKEAIPQGHSSPCQDLPTMPTGYQKDVKGTVRQRSFSPPQERSPTPIEEEESPKSSSSDSEGSPEIPLPPPNEFQLPTRKPHDIAMETTPTVQRDEVASELQPSSPDTSPTPSSDAMLEPPAPREEVTHSPLYEEDASSPIMPDIEEERVKSPEVESSDESDDSEESDSDQEEPEILIPRVSPERLAIDAAPAVTEGLSLVIRLQKHLFTSRRKQLEKLAKVATKQEVESPTMSVFTSSTSFSATDLKSTSVPISIENTPPAAMVVSFSRKLLRYTKYGILPSPSEERVKTTKATSAERVKLRLASFGERRVKPSPTNEDSPSPLMRKRELDTSEMGLVVRSAPKKAKMESSFHPVKVIPQPSSSSSTSSSSEDESESCTPSPYPTPPPPPTTSRSPWQQPMRLEEDEEEDSTPSSNSGNGGGLKLKLKISKALLQSAGVDVSSAKPSRKEKMKAAAAISQRSRPFKSVPQQKSRSRGAAATVRSRGAAATVMQQKTGVIITSSMPAPAPILPPAPEVYICPRCNMPDDGSPMICCDACEDWLHVSMLCGGISQVPPENETWYCPTCARKVKKKSKKRKRYPA